MIEQYLPQINKNATVPNSEIFLELNKAYTKKNSYRQLMIPSKYMFVQSPMSCTTYYILF